MLKHYLYTAWRNLAKYKRQNLISIAGLATGFVCFALSALWIRYELTYDAFHPGAERIYRVRTESKDPGRGSYVNVTPYPLGAYLEKKFPEVETASVSNGFPVKIEKDKVAYDAFVLSADSSFFNLFPLQVISGNPHFLETGYGRAAVTQEMAVRLFGSEDPLGKTFEFYSRTVTVEAVVKSWRHTNIPFDVIRPLSPNTDWGTSSYQTYIRLKPGTDPEKFIQKVRREKIEQNENLASGLTFTPVTALRYTSPDQAAGIKFNHVFLFALAGLLVIVCSLFNYLMLFVSSLKIRSKEFAVRKINGATTGKLFKLLLFEVFFILLAAIVLGSVLIEWLLPYFRHLSEITASGSRIYLETLGYGLLVTVASVVLVLLPVLFYFRKQSLQNSLRDWHGPSDKEWFRKGCIAFQLVISIGFIFCSAVLFRQIYFLQHAETGIVKDNLLTLNAYSDQEEIFRKLSALPEIQKIIHTRSAIFPANTTSAFTVTEWDGKTDNQPAVRCELICVDEHFAPFYEMKFVEGKNFTENTAVSQEIMINEAAREALGWDKVDGKKLSYGWGDDLRPRTITGVVKNYYSGLPTAPLQPVIFVYDPRDATFVIKYRHGDKNRCMAAVNSLMKREFPDSAYNLTAVDDALATYFRSETSLLVLLGFVSAVCILISLFGIYSLASLHCERKKKEIAIRKTLGASTGRLLVLFYKEYLVLLGLSSAVAFAAGYLVMKPWTENYVQRAPFSPVLYLAIFAATLTCVLLTVGWLVGRAVRTNPAEVIRSE